MPQVPIRLQKILSGAGVASRRAAETLILDGRVTVNGRAVTELGTRADPARDDIKVDGRRIRVAEQRIYLLLNKPRGYVTTRSDPEGRPTVLDLLKGIREYVYPIGRLDYDSEGLLFVTNDGDLAERLTHPRHEVERVYEVRVRGLISAPTVARLARGVTIEGRRTAPAKVRRIGASQGTRTPAHRRVKPPTAGARRAGGGSDAPRPARNAGTSTLEFTLHEGRSRQVRKMCDAVGHPVVRLRRVRIGPVRDDQLRVGAYRPLTAREVATLKRAGASQRAGPRGPSHKERATRD